MRKIFLEVINEGSLKHQLHNVYFINGSGNHKYYEYVTSLDYTYGIDIILIKKILTRFFEGPIEFFLERDYDIEQCNEMYMSDEFDKLGIFDGEGDG